MACQAIDCVRHPPDHAVHLAFEDRGGLDLWDQCRRSVLAANDLGVRSVAGLVNRAPVRDRRAETLANRNESLPAVDVEALLQAMACHRPGPDHVTIAFGPDELARLRRILALAGAARGQRLPTRRRGVRAFDSASAMDGSPSSHYLVGTS